MSRYHEDLSAWAATQAALIRAGRLAGALAAAYPQALAWATAETGLAESTFPTTCPFGVEQVLDRAFLPD